MHKVWRLLWVLLAAAAVAVLVRCCGVAVVAIPGHGERPVLLQGDRVAVCRWSYGLRLWPMSRWGYVRLGACRASRGDWVAFNAPVAAADSLPIDGRDLFVAYVQAVPGDSLWLLPQGGITHHPGRAPGQQGIEVPRAGAYVPITPANVHWYSTIINRHEGLHSVVIRDSLYVSGHKVLCYRFSQDYYWVASGGRNNLHDSRSFGFVPAQHLVGRLTRVLYSINPQQPWYSAVRWRRTGTVVGREQIYPQQP